MSPEPKSWRPVSEAEIGAIILEFVRGAYRRCTGNLSPELVRAAEALCLASNDHEVFVDDGPEGCWFGINAIREPGQSVDVDDQFQGPSIMPLRGRPPMRGEPESWVPTSKVEIENIIVNVTWEACRYRRETLCSELIRAGEALNLV